jgi:RNase H-like domain found in reverse transcriptase/Reverse transcriptase (RNA-dependent DNA polymerase)/Integrase zinc binding domain
MTELSPEDAKTERKRIKKSGKRTTNGNNGNSGNGNCELCGKPGHNKADCWEDDRNASKRPPGYKTKNKRQRQNNRNNNELPRLTAEQMSFLMQGFEALKRNEASKKRKVRADDDDDDDQTAHVHFLAQTDSKVDAESNNNTSDYNSDDYFKDYTKNYVLATSHDSKKQKTSHLSTEVVGQFCDSRGNIFPMRVLFDTGSTSTIVLRKFAKNILPQATKTVQWNTMGGQFNTTRKAPINLKLPEFSTNKTITWIAHVDETTNQNKAMFDLIIGLDLMEALGIAISFRDNTITWDDVSIPMKERGLITDMNAREIIFHTAVQSPIITKAETRQKTILDADYSKVDIDETVDQLEHICDEVKRKLKQILKKTPNAFKGGLGTLKIKPISLQLKPNAKPYHAKPFPIPKAYEQTTRKEAKRFQDIGSIWYHNPNAAWAAPTFIHPKKTGDVRILTDLRELNKWIVRKPYPLPKIQDMLQKLEQFSYATALDLSMGYYHIPLDKEAQELCTTILPWGKFSYAKLPMGLCNSPDIFQAVMNDLLGDLSYVLVYLDDILILNTKDETTDDHLRKIEEVLARLENVGFAVNLRKSFFMQKELDYLGYTLTPNGIRPQTKKVEAISRIMSPTNKRQLRRFLGMVNYYRDMWRGRSHVLAPLTGLVSNKTKWKWTEVEERAFEEAKQMVIREALLSYPDFSREFHVYADASDYQLGAVIVQEGKPIAFYTRKLNKAQSKYPTGEKELLSIVETLKEFQNILLGQKVVVHTDHLNLLYNKLASNRLIRWRMMLEEFGPKIEHVAGKNNVVADALSRLEITHADADEVATDEEKPQLTYMTAREAKSENFPMSPILILKEQNKDKELQQKKKDDKSKRYSVKKIEGVSLIHFEGKIFIPKPLRERIITWYHDYLVHPGKTRMEATIRQIFTWPGLKPQVEEWCRTCHSCQLFKKQRKKYGHLPAKKAETKPWWRVNVDCIGPYPVRTPTKIYELRAMTMIDPATGWFEIARIINPNSDEAQRAFDSCWLARYPRPVEVGYDNGSEFKWLFAELCANMGITPKISTEYNPQSNAIIERVHQVLGNALRTFELEKRELDDKEPFEPFLTATAYAIRSTYHTTLKATPGQLVFGRDMILPVQFKANWASIALQKQERINQSNSQENQKRIPHTYKIGDKVLLELPGKVRKMSAPREGPYDVVHVSTNGTVRIKRGAVIQRVNIRRLTPYFDRSPSGSA